MFSSRRTFFGVIGSVAAAMAASAAQLRAPRPTAGFPNPQPNPNPSQPNPNSPFPPPDPKFDPRIMLSENQKEIQKDVAQLTELVAELQKGLDDNDTKSVLSLDVIHKTEEIEKLAKKIRSLIRS